MRFHLAIGLGLSFIILFASCKTHTESPSSCMENPGAEGKLIVIVGEKIDVKEIEPDTSWIIYYSRYKAHYRIVEKICGDYYKDTITFIAADHYGFPSFAEYDHALLFLTNYKGTIYHEIYQFFPLYKTKNGRWASSYRHSEYGDETKVKPEKINFAEEVSYSTEGLTRTTRQRIYPEPYYKIDLEKKKAIAVWGNYVPELFQLKKDGVLKYRGFFGKVDSTKFKAPKYDEITTEFAKLEKKDSIGLIKTWRQFLKAIKEDDSSAIKNMSADSVICSVCEGMPRLYYENNLESIDMFIDSANVNFRRSDLWKVIGQNKFKISVTRYPSALSKILSLSKDEKLTVYEIRFPFMVTVDEGQLHQQYHFFRFVKKGNRFLFYQMESQS